jgi:hypothetical protein
MRPTRRLALRTLALGLAFAPLRIARAADDSPGRQIVMFAVLATPGSSAMDAKIPAAVAARLRRTLPNHGFRLIKVKSGRVLPGESLGLDLGGGFKSQAQLITPQDPNGKVQMRFDLSLDGVSQFQSVVTTPADQFNFFDKMLPDDSRLLIGVGAR